MSLKLPIYGLNTLNRDGDAQGLGYGLGQGD
jgi:hypothetical protein